MMQGQCGGWKITIHLFRALERARQTTQSLTSDLYRVNLLVNFYSVIVPQFLEISKLTRDILVDLENVFININLLTNQCNSCIRLFTLYSHLTLQYSCRHFRSYENCSSGKLCD